MPAMCGHPSERLCRDAPSDGARLAATVSRPGGRGPGSHCGTGSRKVGAPQGRVLANGQSG